MFDESHLSVICILRIPLHLNIHNSGPTLLSPVKMHIVIFRSHAATAEAARISHRPLNPSPSDHIKNHHHDDTRPPVFKIFSPAH